MFFLAGCLTHVIQRWQLSPVTDMVPPPALSQFLLGNIMHRACPILAKPRQPWLLKDLGPCRDRFCYKVAVPILVVYGIVLPLFIQAVLLFLPLSWLADVSCVAAPIP